jgi:Fic family protein
MTKQPFIPPELPPKIDYSRLIREIGLAHSALGNLNGLLRKIANPNLLMTPLITKEAVLSSRIEGTIATLEDVLKYEAEKSGEEATEKERDVREILNYRIALRKAMKMLEQRPIGENLLKTIHEVLLASVRGEKKDRGNFRRMQVYIGAPGTPIEEAAYIPPPITEVPRLLSNWEKYINSEEEKDTLVQMGIAHYQFEAIHPFMDGNGRIGRLIIPLYLFERKLLSHPILYISEYFELHRKDYYDLLNRVSTDKAWEAWLKFFLDAVIVQSGKAEQCILEIFDLYEKLKQEVTAINSVYAINLLDIVFKAPIIKYAEIKDKIKGASAQTIFNLIGKFEKAGILKEISGYKRNRIYAFEKLLRILKSKS